MISRGYETIGQEYAKITHVIAVFKPTFDFFLHKTLISLFCQNCVIQFVMLKQ